MFILCYTGAGDEMNKKRQTCVFKAKIGYLIDPALIEIDRKVKGRTKYKS